jgi:8-hydroxy-5-deazaflavin:NADPH oxidoreductase
MEIGILGSGSVGQVFAKFALHAGHQIKISNSRGPDSLTDLVQKLGPRATAATSEEAAKCEMVLLAIPWDDVPKTLSSFGDWGSRILIDATNPYHGRHGAFTLADVGNLSTSQCVAQLAAGAKVVKAINHMIMSNFEAGGDANGAKRVAFVAGDDSGSKQQVSALLGQFGFHPVDLGNLRDGGLMQQAGGPLAGLDFLVRV